MISGFNSTDFNINDLMKVRSKPVKNSFCLETSMKFFPSIARLIYQMIGSNKYGISFSEK